MSKSRGGASRRAFLKRLAGGAAAIAASSSGWARALEPAARGVRGANDRIGIGIIGVGDLGRHHHLSILMGIDEVEVLAVADVDSRHVDDAIKKAGSRVKGYKDYRNLLDRSDIDAVLIATPDHWHALPTIHACQAGKDVYCEKPLTLTIAEGRAMVNAARRHGRIVQTGTQQRSDALFRQAAELIRNGRIGKLASVKIVLGTAPTTPRRESRPQPAELDWDFWLGPCPSVPYHDLRCHYNFRWFDDYSGGKLTDWGAHHLDILQWAMGAEASGPVSVRGTGVFPADNLYTVPSDFDVHFTYANGIPVHVTGEGENGLLFTGDKGKVFVCRGEIRADPPELLDEPSVLHEVRLEASADHHRNWLECMRTRRRPIADVEHGHRSATVCHLGNIAIKLGRELKWNPEAERFVDDPEADRLIARPMREPWSLPQ